MNLYCFILCSVLLTIHCASGQNVLDQNVKLKGVKVLNPGDVQFPAQNTLLRDALQDPSATIKDDVLPQSADFSGIETAIGDLAVTLSSQSQAAADLVTTFVRTLQTGGNVNALVGAVNKLPESERNYIISQIEEKINSLSASDITLLNETYPDLLSAVTMNGGDATSGNGQSSTGDATSGSEQSSAVHTEVHTHSKTEISKLDGEVPDIAPLIVPGPQFLDVTHKASAIGKGTDINKGKEPIGSASVTNNQLKTSSTETFAGKTNEPNLNDVHQQTVSSADPNTAEAKRFVENIDLTPDPQTLTENARQTSEISPSVGETSGIPVTGTDTSLGDVNDPSKTITFINEEGKRVVVDSRSLPTDTNQQTVLIGGDGSTGTQTTVETIVRKPIDISAQEGVGVNLIDAELPPMINFNMNYDTSELKADQMDLVLRDRSRQDAISGGALRLESRVVNDDRQSAGSGGIDTQLPDSKIPIVISAREDIPPSAESSASSESIVSINPDSEISQISTGNQQAEMTGPTTGHMITDINFDMLKKLNADVIDKHGESAFAAWVRKLPGLSGTGRTGFIVEDRGLALPFTNIGRTVDTSPSRNTVVTEQNPSATGASSAAESEIIVMPMENRRNAQSEHSSSFVPYNRPSQIYIPSFRPPNVIRRPRVTIIPRYFRVEPHYRHQFGMSHSHRRYIPGRRMLQYPPGPRFHRRPRFPLRRYPCRYDPLTRRCIRHRYPMPPSYFPKRMRYPQWA